MGVEHTDEFKALCRGTERGIPLPFEGEGSYLKRERVRLNLLLERVELAVVSLCY